MSRANSNSSRASLGAASEAGKEKVVEMKSAVDVDDAAVQQMVEESVEHAFEDLAARRWVEAKLKANQLIVATRKGLADCAAELDQQYTSKVESALREVEATISAENPETKIGDAQRLQVACTPLHEVTVYKFSTAK